MNSFQGVGEKVEAENLGRRREKEAKRRERETERDRGEERGEEEERKRQRAGKQAHRSAPCADCGNATVPPTGGSFPLSHSASPPKITRASVVGGNSYTVMLSSNVLPSTHEPQFPMGPDTPFYIGSAALQVLPHLHVLPSPKRPVDFCCSIPSWNL